MVIEISTKKTNDLPERCPSLRTVPHAVNRAEPEVCTARLGARPFACPAARPEDARTLKRKVVDLAQITVRGFGRVWPSGPASTYECSRRSHSDLATT